MNLNRIYQEIQVGDLTIPQIQSLIDSEGAHYAGDYGLEFRGTVNLIISQN